ncbi:hypothetical protein LCGC14_2877640 [marine sediment metagenome]|uniref:Terminase large subunit gp17-like C-terminal domain-containing protein n=1 Tax=marine sediment metagenome TaxID=412755 RepID=A0A0F8Y195_9ZZZZ
MTPKYSKNSIPLLLERPLSPAETRSSTFQLLSQSILASSQCDLRIFEGLNGQRDIRPIPNQRGLLAVWKRPQKGSQYVIGADVAEGIEIDGAPADDKHDYSTLDVIDRNTGEQVCTFHGRLTPDEFGRQSCLIGRWYNDAFAGVENNGGYGGHVLVTMESEGYPLSQLYRDAQLRKMGWTTTRANRKSLMSNLDMSIRSREVLINSEDTVNELKAFVTKPDGRIEAGSGRKDDRVFSLAIANKMLEVAPPIFSDKHKDSTLHYQRLNIILSGLSGQFRK